MLRAIQAFRDPDFDPVSLNHPATQIHSALSPSWPAKPFTMHHGRRSPFPAGTHRQKFWEAAFKFYQRQCLMYMVPNFEKSCFRGAAYDL